MAQFASDSFTGTAGTVLPTYSANWTKHGSSGSGNQIISDGGTRLRHESGTSAEAIYYHSGSPASANYTVYADFVNGSSGSGNGNMGICGRMDTSANTFYYVRWSDTAIAWQLYRRVAGTFTLLGSYAVGVSAGVTYTGLLTMDGSDISFTLDGVVRISVADASPISAAGKSGTRSNLTGGTEAVMFMLDNFSADDIGAAGGQPIIKRFGGVPFAARNLGVW